MQVPFSYLDQQFSDCDAIFEALVMLDLAPAKLPMKRFKSILRVIQAKFYDR